MRSSLAVIAYTIRAISLTRATAASASTVSIAQVAVSCLGPIQVADYDLWRKLLD